GFREGLSQNFGDFFNEMAWLKQHALSFHSAGKSEYLPDHIGTALGARFEDAKHALALWILELLLEDLDGHHYGSEDVVQVMRDAPGKRPDAFHPLGAKELGFDFFALC